MLTTYITMRFTQMLEREARRSKKEKDEKRKYEAEVCALSDFEIIFPATTCVQEIISMM